jgi:hypothetical protein
MSVAVAEKNDAKLSDAFAELASKKASAFTEVASVLMDETKPLSEVMKAVSPTAMSVVWADGSVEFGRRKFIITGNPRLKDSVSRVIVESDKIEWTGQKTAGHKPFANFNESDEIPVCKEYLKYVMEHDVKDDIDFAVRKTITREEAVQLLTLQVRLTDKGLKSLQAA